MWVDFWGTCLYVLSSLPVLPKNFLAVGIDITEIVGVAGADEKNKHAMWLSPILHPAVLLADCSVLFQSSDEMFHTFNICQGGNVDNILAFSDCLDCICAQSCRVKNNKRGTVEDYRPIGIRKVHKLKSWRMKLLSTFLWTIIDHNRPDKHCNLPIWSCVVRAAMNMSLLGYSRLWSRNSL